MAVSVAKKAAHISGLANELAKLSTVQLAMNADSIRKLVVQQADLMCEMASQIEALENRINNIAFYPDMRAKDESSSR